MMHVLTALLPILIPEREDGMNGDFIFNARRKLHQNFLEMLWRNLLSKIQYHNFF